MVPGRACRGRGSAAGSAVNPQRRRLRRVAAVAASLSCLSFSACGWSVTQPRCGTLGRAILPVPLAGRPYLGDLGTVGRLSREAARAEDPNDSRGTAVADEPQKSQIPVWRRPFAWLTDAESRRKCASMGAAGLVAYHLLSLVNYIPLWGFAWYAVAKRTGMSPFLELRVFFSACFPLFVANNILRPAKVAAAAALVPMVDRWLNRVMQALAIGKKRACALVSLGAVAVAVPLQLLGFALASSLARVPLW